LADPLACNDPIAARRYAYARAAADDGDWAAAAEVFAQAAEQALGGAPAWFVPGEARDRLGDVDGVGKAFRVALDASDAQGASTCAPLRSRSRRRPRLWSAMWGMAVNSFPFCRK
jgi:hypothetical protein